MLLCNYRKCKQPLRICAIATVCRHIFCMDHNPLQVKGSDGAIQCPVCRTRLKGACEIIEVDMQPCEQFKTMILMGQNPETIFDVCKRALEFYAFQKSQETKYHEYVNYKLTEKLKSMETHCKAVVANLESKSHRLQSEKDALVKECEELRDHLVASGQKLSRLESELQKLSLLKKSDSTQGTKDPLNITRDRFRSRPLNEPRSEETMCSKFPRCSPDSTYASPGTFALRSGFPLRNFRKNFESSNMFSQLRSTAQQSEISEPSPNNISDSFKNVSRISGSLFYQ
ncbi:E3 ubiquitin-protein ligase CCNP1IP1 [Paragonimus westermani]|uniref:E3 ubiquitin-protein ligase CCNP1IP1 n=1 Tax=Paragonimus westermani TaxID=34504 RepID=A0A5J4NTD0_9TREM|nr:E3 ubiquitin-protein ligase CCNP1IP1 [Paragonimus westermani]